MKRIFSLLTVCTLSLAFTSCGGGGSKSPKEVTETFVKAIQKQDFATAKEHATDKTGKLLDMMKSMMEKMGDDKKMKQGEFKEIKKSEKDGKEATVTYCCNKEGKDDEMKLKKVDGQWKVHFDKQMPGKGAKKE